jgi:predicted metal-dependent HD superfamily phosphohydrolase
MNDNIYKKVAQHVTKVFDEYPHPNLVYHNLDHTRKVVERVQEIAAHYQLNEQDMLAVYVAAWFHDVGHLFADIPTHEQKGVELMREFMTQHGAEESLISSIESCIIATRMPHEPKNMLEEILCDADTYHFGTNDFKKTNKQVRKEYELRNFTTYIIDWEKNTVDLLERHRFFTSYCQVLLSDGKQKNIERARRKYLKTVNAIVHAEQEEEEDPKLAKAKQSLVSRGIQTMLRLTSENHLRLSDMADSKANILISVNAIIISVILSVLMRKLEVDTYLTIPTILFLISSVVTIVIAILATMPKISEGRFTKPDVINKQINLLFFGNFYKSTLEEYEWAMGILMKDKDYLYGSLVKDIYYLGKILGRKYKLIKLAYTVFMIGIIMSVIAFTVASLIGHAGGTATTVTMPQNTPL